MLQKLQHLKFSKSKLCEKTKVPSYLARYGLKRTTSLALIIALVVLAIASVMQLILPIKLYKPDIFSARVGQGDSRLEIGSEAETQISMTHPIRSGLFKPSRRVVVSVSNDNTVEKIFNSLKLQCIMSIGKQKVAYIVLSDGGMRKCKVGDSIKDMFTVTDIQKSSVNIDILGHKRTLNK